LPTYEYRCRNGHVFEVVQSMTDDPISACTQCGAPVERVFHPIAIHFKGSGFYSTDYGRSRGGAGVAGDSASGDSASGDSASSADSKSSSDSKSSGESKSSSDSKSAGAGNGSKGDSSGSVAKKSD
jgi:putative FmdB family regulatory protein